MTNWFSRRWHAWRFRREQRAFHRAQARAMDDFTLSWYASGGGQLTPMAQRIIEAEARRRGMEVR